MKYPARGPAEFIERRDQSKRRGYLSPLEPGGLADHQLFTSHGGKVGFALDSSGDIQNVFNNGGPKGSGVDALAEAIDRGGRTLDCYDGHLPDLYTQVGFVETGRMTFSRDFAPPGWDYERDDDPDVVFMAWRGWPDGDREGSLARAKDKSRAGWVLRQESERYYPGDQWDEAKNESRAAVRERGASTAIREIAARDTELEPPPEAREKYTPGEIEILAIVARTKGGWEWPLRHAYRILEEARTIYGDDLE